jgi:hypothetical protein
VRQRFAGVPTRCAGVVNRVACGVVLRAANVLSL